MGIRIMVKGGVWKNTEDEILKAAVMKYGLNQWPRVASLLNRKSAAQCKARWYEWLDPSIKKTEWTREEEEKLLHLAKILPSQWRTIAPLVGRTAAQCLEHYERLLDAAQQQAGDMDEERKGDARKLRPGEIDPHPETKPARPDPIDMDEDEKEMLSEARARLANTRGKKAKRKAREKMLNEAKRLASLQKRRELKAAGMEFKMREKKRKYIDYAREIPFYRPAPAGFYDTTEEKEVAKKQALDPTFEALRVDKLEAKRRDDEEQRERAKDRKRQKKIMEDNLPAVVMAINERNDPISIRRRVPLNLPAPQVTEAELEELVKGGATPMLTDGSEATSALLGDYRDRPTPLATPMRTPKTAAAQDIVMQEARNLLALSKLETPLKGGENPVMEEGTGFDSHVPRSSKAQTPNVLASGKRQGMESGGATPGSATPMSVRSGSASTLRSSHPGNATPMRDQLGLNKPERDEYQLMVLNEKKRLKQQKAMLLTGLEGLPAPQYMYDIEVPTEEVEAEKAAPEVEEDAADRDARLAAAKRAQEEAELARRSTAIKRELPRPATVNADPIRSLISKAVESGEEQAVADALIQQELLRVLQHDTVRYPVKGQKEGKKKKGSSATEKVDLPIIDPEDLVHARDLIEKEIEGSGVELPELEEFEEAWGKGYGEMAYFPERQAWGRVSAASKQDRLAATQHQFEVLAQALEKDAKKVGKVEMKVTIKTQGYTERSKKLRAGMEETLEEIDTMKLELTCFQRLHGLEKKAVIKRLAKLEQEVQLATDREEVLQETYANLCDERDQLFEKLQEVIEGGAGKGQEGAATAMET